MTYNDIFFRNNIVANIPLVYEGRKLGKSEAASVMLVRVAYANKVQEYEKYMEEVLKGLKKEGFDERSRAIAEMEDVDRRKKAAEQWKQGDKDDNGKPVGKPEMSTKEELEKSEKTRETKEEYDKELKELEEAYGEARRKQGEKDVKLDAKFTRAEYAEICELIGYEGDFEISSIFTGGKEKISKEMFLGLIASNLVLQ